MILGKKKTTDEVIRYFTITRDEYFATKDIVKMMNLRYNQVKWVIGYWKRYGKVERVKLVRNSKGHNEYAIYRLKTAGKKYINNKAQELIYAV